MKKILFMLAVLAMIGVSCSKDNANRASGSGGKDDETEDPTQEPDPKPDPEPEGPSVKTGAENLVIHISFDKDDLLEVGEGITFKENKGQASITTGFIGKGWTNKSGNNATEAYSKFDVAAGSAFSKIENFSMSVWIKNVEANPKGCIISLNGARMGIPPSEKPHDFPAFNVYFDNNGTDSETGERWQQVNGRFIFHDSNRNEQNLWLDTGAPALAVYGEWFHLAVTYEPAAKTGYIYVNGEEIRELTFDPGIPFNNLVTEYTNALYIGAWSTFVEGDSVQTWQNYWPGAIDELRIFDRILTPEEVLALYKEELDINLSQDE